jgi:DNA-binding response OmpR family regulator
MDAAEGHGRDFQGMIMRVLILEDDPFIALDLRAIVEGDGHEVVGAFDSIAEATEHLADGFDYALLDIDVTDGKSFTLAAELMERRIPFAFVSASRPSEVPSHLKKASFIAKPFEERAVLRSIERSALA